MDGTVHRVRVVLVSPGDVAAERAAARAVVEELNRGEADDRELVLSLWAWETDSWPGLHLEGPQGRIDEQMGIEDADVVIGIFWTRFGTPTHDANSGTEHELRRALAAWKERERPQVMVYFCVRPFAPGARADLAQWDRVLAFRDEFDGCALTGRYEEVTEFEAKLREHLGQFLRFRSTMIPAARVPASRAVENARVMFNVPLVAASFAGREEELAAIDEAFEARDGAVITQALTGLGGIGKTQLAARYVQRSASHYGVVAWIRAQDGGIADLAGLAAKLGLPVDGLTPTERAHRALEWLSSSDDAWLLVLDNVESPGELERLLPRGGNGRVLVTSRDRALSQFAQMLPISVFDDSTATSYLVDRADRHGDEEAAAKLARALGCLPLALAHASAYCASGTSFADYQDRLDALPARELFTSHPERFYELTVASTWKTSIRAAAEEAPLAADVLEMASFLGPDAIPKTLFEVLVADSTPSAKHQLTLAFNALARFSLATISDTSLSVHRLLQKTVRDDSIARGDEGAFANAVRGVDETLASIDETALPAVWPLCEQLLPHAAALARTRIERGQRGPQVVGVLNRACRYLYYAGGGTRAVEAAETARGYAERILDPDHPGTLRARANVAASLRSAGRISEALRVGERVLADSQRILGAEHRETLFARIDLANTCLSAGRAKEAIAMGESVLADRERILGVEHPDTLSARGNLASSYRAAGRVAKALALEAASRRRR